ncbi:MAG: uridine kinase [Chitinophagales bacterium]|nr:uridine kinase [Chitinophagales bacterium]
MQKPYLIGVTGGSGSGKTTFINKLKDIFSEEQICFLSMDNYYKPREIQEKDENNEYHFDLPSSFKRKDFARDVKKLMNGEVVRLMEYTFNNPLASAREVVYRPASIIIVEGIYVLYFEEIVKLLDLRIYLDAHEHLKLIRRIKRDAEERNYPLEDVLYRYEKHVFPTFKKYIEPTKFQADIIINNNENLDGAIKMVMPFLENKINKQLK